ncbi:MULTISPECIES: GNAT family N-acetyltransferase [Subtercola]|uniref:N-acetyltransferase n=1 Tax=Subtercola vilae TaxID=2056433 RepID=A0A4T2C6U9_9MICO|nr:MULTISPECIES: GNAT family protein [Subtercola]MEA9985428.1 GNAT family protein [Subtercola sp. RTI3]TIH39342.1 N-acetyltransferase [Subtercola vilae]
MNSPLPDFAAVPTLVGERLTLEPLSLEHVPDLSEAVAEGELWRTWYTRIPSPDEMADAVQHRLDLSAAGQWVPWAVRRHDTNRVVGMTSYLNIRADNRKLEIGSTWLGRSSQRTGLNTEAKLLQLTHAFETLGCIAVEFRTHWHNSQSRAAIARLGAKQDGVLRNNDIWRDGTLRDTVVFSIIEGEWPTVRLGLTEKVAGRA